jgi:NADP-dependent aldehyde dehydrogenase
VTTVQGVDPRTGEVAFAPVPETTADELELLLASAAAAASALGTARPQVRADLLRALADALDASAAELVALATVESGLPEARLTGEVARTSGQLRLFAEVALDGSYLGVIIDSS